MNRKIKVAQYGCGKMSVYTMKYVYDKGAEIVAAFDINENIIGKDIGEIIGSENKGVVVNDVKNAEKILKDTKPDICIITTMSLMVDVYDTFKLCAKHGTSHIHKSQQRIPQLWHCSIGQQ